MSFARRAAAVCLSVAAVTGCSKKAPPPPAREAPPAPAPSEPPVTELAPLDDDGGPGDATPEARKRRGVHAAAAYDANQARIKQCCDAMRGEAKKLGSSPEAIQIGGLAAQCDVLAAQVGPLGTSPELNQLRQILKSVKLPAACQM